MGPKHTPWQNSKKRDEAIANSGLPYRMPLYHIKVPDYRATDKVLDKLDRDMRTIGETGYITTPDGVEISIMEPVSWREFIGSNLEISELGLTCIDAETEVNSSLMPYHLQPSAWRDGFHVSVLDPYPEGA